VRVLTPPAWLGRRTPTARVQRPSVQPARALPPRILLALAAALLLPCACGLPRDGVATSVPPTAVPYNLLSPAPSDTSSSSPAPTERTTAPHLYLVNVDDELVPVRMPVAARGLDPVESQLLGLLTAGPTERQRRLGLASALTPGTRIRLVGTDGGTATIEVQRGPQEPSADRLPLAVGQLVLTATSVQGITAVQLTREGRPVEVPLPGGALTSAPLTAADYAPLVVPSAASRMSKADPRGTQDASATAPARP